VATGLSRTERQLLEVLAAGSARPVPLFVAAQRKEEALFLGDWPFWRCVHELSQGPAPLVAHRDGGPFLLPEWLRDTARQPAFLEQVVTLTAQGRAVLAGQADWMHLYGIDRWLGGVHLTGHTPAWRWDETQGKVVAMPTAAP
jgi:hypothetical protein